MEFAFILFHYYHSKYLVFNTSLLHVLNLKEKKKQPCSICVSCLTRLAVIAQCVDVLMVRIHISSDRFLGSFLATVTNRKTKNNKRIFARVMKTSGLKMEVE
jgi:hypothetical protein